MDAWCRTGTSPDSAEVFEAKSRLRRELSERIDRLSPEEIKRQSEAITRKVLQHPKYQESESVSIYLSFDKEVQTEEILHDIFAQGKECYIPQYFKGKPMEMVQILSLEDYQDLPKNKWNIKQPPKDEIRENVLDAGRLDLILLPGLGFTSTGKRLGRGKGYYDEYLVRSAALLDNSPYTIALAFSEQLVEDIPMTDKDVCVDEVISP
ncbi:5-formyltetrahydrofolate cyclo-ligase-like [Ischnura elegans]|uniref:5-formyltetrahydrofolate cyclo-ligase-like n=1 Tax=Ischnura elegans TaxID=197161 RepID=UPI001ED8A538|nr:5-formyltetrahydrofolate cyclo-ligase-like [Ischnura elegans]